MSSFLVPFWLKHGAAVLTMCRLSLPTAVFNIRYLHDVGHRIKEIYVDLQTMAQYPKLEVGCLECGKIPE